MKLAAAASCVCCKGVRQRGAGLCYSGMGKAVAARHRQPVCVASLQLW
jgi:hypothetical protein